MNSSSLKLFVGTCAFVGGSSSLRLDDFNPFRDEANPRGERSFRNRLSMSAEFAIHFSGTTSIF